MEPSWPSSHKNAFTQVLDSRSHNVDAAREMIILARVARSQKNFARPRGVFRSGKLTPLVEIVRVRSPEGLCFHP